VEVVRSVCASFERSLADADAGGEGGGFRRSFMPECLVYPGENQLGAEGGPRTNVKPDTSDGQFIILAWLKKIGVHVSDEWLPKCETAVDVGKKSMETKAHDSFLNGVMLSELAAAVEKLNNATEARANLRMVDDQRLKIKRFMLQGTTLQPKCYAQVENVNIRLIYLSVVATSPTLQWYCQVLHNVQLALDVFRRMRREVNGRYLFSAEEIARGDEAVSKDLPKVAVVKRNGSVTLIIFCFLLCHTGIMGFIGRYF